MKYQNKILSVLKEAINTSTEVQDITTATQNAENQFKSQGFGDEQSKTLAINAVTKSVMGDDDTMEESNDIVTEVEGEEVHTAKFDRCVKDVEKEGKVDNPYAICQASIGADAIKKDHRTKPEDEYDRTDRADEGMDNLEVPDDIEANEQDYEVLQQLKRQAAEEEAKRRNESVVGKIKKGELERVMESLKPKKKIIKVRELKKSK
tara:strand:- start:453 stop:1070 length:618 start_codon:yes stop_codon:yes gene_type:complete